MTYSSTAESKIGSYLATVRSALRGLPQMQIEDILRELRGHALELAEGKSAEAAIESLGDPVDLAKTYRAESEMVHAECSGSPLSILMGLRHASRTSAGRVAVTALYVFAYANVLALWAAAVDKVFAPSRTGFWYTPADWFPFKLVTGGGQPGGRELLGWWLVPATIVAGWILRYLIDWVARWWLRRYRQSKALHSL